MRKFWIALAVCGGAAGFLAWGTAMPTQAAMMINGTHADMSMVEQVAKKKAKAAAPVCNNYLLMKCCTAKGKETCTPGPM
jgi:C4-dicarboxylate transporter